MSLDDKERWEKKYARNFVPKDNVEVVEKYAALASGTKALDIACGMGRNSKFLAKNGFEVEALDISPTAVASLQNIPNLYPKEVDFDSYTLEENKYDLVVCTYFLKRELFPQMIKALKPNGILIFETFMHHPDNTKAPSDKSFLLEAGELERSFSKELEIIHLNEFWKEGVCGDKVLRACVVGKK